MPAQEESRLEETCSCTKAVVDGNLFAGLTCEYGAPKSCMTLGSDSKHSFCTNGGECQDIVGDNELYVVSSLKYFFVLLRMNYRLPTIFILFI